MSQSVLTDNFSAEMENVLLRSCFAMNSQIAPMDPMKMLAA
jgi:hypothetical protein